MYIKIFQEHAIPVIKNLYSSNNYYFQEDNILCYIIKATKNLLKKSEFKDFYSLLPV